MTEDKEIKTEEKVYGTVHLHSFFHCPQGYQIKNVTGNIKVAEALEVIGIKVGRSESNWFVTVQGETQFCHIPGCQVLAISHHSPADNPGDSWILK